MGEPRGKEKRGRFLSSLAVFVEEGGGGRFLELELALGFSSLVNVEETGLVWSAGVFFLVDLNFRAKAAVFMHGWSS